MAEEEKADGQQAKPKTTLILVVAVLVALVTGGGVAAFFLVGSNDGRAAAASQEPPHPSAIYFDFKPPFIVNYQWNGRQRYVQVSLSVLTRQAAVVDALQLHMPLLRNNLLMVLSEQNFDTLRTPEGKVALRQVLLDELQKTMTEKTGEPGIEQVLFTNFVMQ